MKLPGIETGSVQSLGRMSTQLPLQLSRAKSREAEAKANLATTAMDTAGGLAKGYLELFEANAEAEANKALLKYQEDLITSVTTEPEVDEEGNYIWTKPDRINELTSEAEESARTYLSSDRSKILFDEHRHKVDFKVQSAWTEKLTKAQLNNAKINFLDSLESHAKLHDWDSMSNILESPGAKLVLTPVQQVQYKQVLQRGKQLDEYEYQRQVALGDPTKVNNLREKVLNDQSLAPTDKRNLLASIDQSNINYVITATSEVAAAKARAEGAIGAVTHLDSIIYETLNTPAEELGGDEKYKASLIDKLQAIRNDYKGYVQQNTGVASKANVAKLILSNQMRVSPRHNQNEYNETYLMIMGGQFDKNGKYVKGSIKEADIINDKDGMLTDSIAYVREYGFMPKFFETALGTFLINGSAEEQMKVLDVFSELSAFDPETLFVTPQASYAKDLFSLVQVAGQTKEGRKMILDLWHKRQSLGENELKMYNSKANSLDFRKTVKKETKRLLKEKFPAIEYFIFHARPDIREGLKDRINTMAGQFLPLANGDSTLAVNMALESLKYEYGVTYTPNGAQLVHFPPGQVMTNKTGLTPQQNDAWIYDQMTAEVKQSLGDEDYDTDYITLEPVPDFDRNEPQYIIMDTGPKWGGMATALGIYKPVFEDTSIAKVKKTTEIIRGERATRNAELAAKASVWKAEHPEAIANADPVIKYLWTPYEGLIPRMLQKTQDVWEDAMIKIFGPELVRNDNEATN